MVWSDSGNGRAYTTMSLRGLHQTRLSFTLDGMPLNDPEDSGVYPSNLGDLSGALDAVQVQRGSGASSLGAPSLGVLTWMSAFITPASSKFANKGAMWFMVEWHLAHTTALMSRKSMVPPLLVLAMLSNGHGLVYGSTAPISTGVPPTSAGNAVQSKVSCTQRTRRNAMLE